MQRCGNGLYTFRYLLHMGKCWTLVRDAHLPIFLESVTVVLPSLPLRTGMGGGVGWGGSLT